jgi:hypothetical protein
MKTLPEGEAAGAAQPDSPLGRQWWLIALRTAVLLILLLTVLFLVAVVAPSAGAAGGCGGG